MLKTRDLYDLDHTIAAKYLENYEYPWQALKGISELILALGPTLGADYDEISPSVWVHKTAHVFPSAYLGAPCIIGANTEVRHCAFIRGSALVGSKCVVGTIASGDQFIASPEKKKQIKENFGAISCEMEGAAVGQVCYVNRVPFAVIRAISDDADGGACEDYPTFAKMAANNSVKAVLRFIDKF